MSKRTAGMPFILITLFLDIFGIGLIIPIFPNLVRSFVNQDTGTAAQYFGLFAAVYALMQFIFSPVLGSLSDRFGRRPVLLTALTGQGLDYLLLAFAPTLWWLLVGRILAGITGASIGTATAYIADVSPPEKRAQNFGMVGAAFGLGFICGPALGGLLGENDLRTPFLVASGLSLLNALYGLFVLPESLPPERRRPFSWASANPVGTLWKLAKNPVVLGLAGPIFLLNLAQRGLESTWVLYTGYRFGWGVRATGISLALVGLGALVVQGGLIRKIIPKIGERRAMLLGTGAAVLAFTGYGLATKGWMIYAIIPFGALAGLSAPSLQGLMSKSVSGSEQGLLQGGLAGLISLTQIAGPPIATQLFNYFISPRAPVRLPGAAFFFGALLLLAAMAMALRNFSRQPATLREAPQG